MATKKQQPDTITIPRWLYEQLQKDHEFVFHLTHYRGIGWVKAVREELELDKKYHEGAFKRYLPTTSNDGHHVSCYILRDKLTGKFVSRNVLKVNHTKEYESPTFIGSREEGCE